MAYEKISKLIESLQKIKTSFGDTVVFYTDLCWGGLAMNKKDDYENKALQENEESMNVTNVSICTCGRVMFSLDDYDTLGSDSGICCPDCGNEKFQTVGELQAENDRYKKAIQHWQLCLDAAYGEGLDTVLRDSNDERLKDLIERRLLYDTELTFSKALKGKE